MANKPLPYTFEIKSYQTCQKVQNVNLDPYPAKAKFRKPEMTFLRYAFILLISIFS